MSSGVLPNDWLVANITPVFKKGDKKNSSNYRPISLTAICCKIMEHIVYHSIMDHLDNYNILHNYQYGFRQGHSSETTNYCCLGYFIGASLSEPHTYVENGRVVHAQTTAVKNGIATHYCSLVWWFMYKQTR